MVAGYMSGAGEAVREINKRKRRTFDEWLADAKAYRDKHGDLLVPNDYVTPEGCKLGRWIERKRAQYNGVKSINGHIYSDEIAALNAIGMIWKLEYRFGWDVWIEQVALFYNTNGHLNVPKEYVNGKYSLGNWLIEQRQKYAAGELSRQQVAELEKYHICWKLSSPRGWEGWYAVAKQYYETYGNLRVRADYITESGERLGRWICSQRDCYNRRPGKRRLLASEIEKLEEIGMIWSVAKERDASWEQMLTYTKSYMSQYGRLPVRTSEKILTPDGRNLTNWVRAQRDRCRKGLLKEERVAALREAGILEYKNRKKAIVYDRRKTGMRIRTMRSFLRIPIDEAAEALQIAEHSYRDIESGKADMSLDTAMRVASYYHVPLSYLVYGKWKVYGHLYTQESAAIVFMLRCGKAEKRKQALQILRVCLTE